MRKTIFVLIAFLAQVLGPVTPAHAAIEEMWFIDYTGQIFSGTRLPSGRVAADGLGNIKNFRIPPAGGGALVVGAKVVIVAEVVILIVEVALIADGIDDINIANTRSGELNQELSNRTGLPVSHYENADQRAKEDAYRACIDSGTFWLWCQFDRL